MTLGMCPEGSLAQRMHWANVDSPPACRGLASAGQQTRQVFCTMDDEVYPEHLCQPQPRPTDRRPCSLQPCPQTKR